MERVVPKAGNRKRGGVSNAGEEKKEREEERKKRKGRKRG